jgi:hypothetical protein
MPIPVSITRSETTSAERRSTTSMRPSFGVNLVAFESRFQTICWSLVGSPNTMHGSSER